RSVRGADRRAARAAAGRAARRARAHRGADVAEPPGASAAVDRKRRRRRACKRLRVAGPRRPRKGQGSPLATLKGSPYIKIIAATIAATIATAPPAAAISFKRFFAIPRCD